MKNKVKLFAFGFVLGFFCFLFALIGGFLEEYEEFRTGGRFSKVDYIIILTGGIFGQIVSMYLIHHYYMTMNT